MLLSVREGKGGWGRAKGKMTGMGIGKMGPDKIEAKDGSWCDKRTRVEGHVQGEEG